MSVFDRKLRQKAKAITRQREAGLDPSINDLAGTLQGSAKELLSNASPNAAEEYFHHAQQAYQLAATGGCVANGFEADYIDSSTGRSVFISLAVRIHPVQRNRLLDVGYSALCFPQDPDDATNYEEFREMGNWM